MNREGAIILAILIISAILFLSPFLYHAKKNPGPVLSWAPGYWQFLPGIGMARIVPISPCQLISPAAGSGLRSLREPASNAPLRKY